MRALLVVLVLVQFGQRPPLSPAETLLEPALLEAMSDVVPDDGVGIEIVRGSDPSAGEIVVSCYRESCSASYRAGLTLRKLIDGKAVAPPARTIRFFTLEAASDVGKLIDKDPILPVRTKVVLHVHVRGGQMLHIYRSPWSLATIADEVVEILARQAPFGARPGAMEVRPFFDYGGPAWHSYGIPTVKLAGGEEGDGDGIAHAAFVTAASAYFLATLPNAGAEALLSHLMVGAHARLAEDGRKAVAQMGTQQRASADVLIMFGQAVEREQRRIRSFERFMPAPVDPLLRSRLTDMEKGITSVWTSIGITNAPFVPAAERIRGRGGEDRRVPSRLRDGPLPTPDPPTAMLKFPNVAEVVYELGNFIDGKRSISDIRDAVSAEFGPMALPVVVEYFERLAKAGAVSIR